MLGECDMTAGDIAAQFAISAPSVSHHLNVLKQAGLIQSQRNGQTLVYSLNTTVVQEFVQEVMQFFNIGEDNHA
jgi:DNA-binding transcriptional ArsR family regulator